MATAKQPAKGPAPKTILVVEDHPTNLQMAVEMLEMDGWQIHQAGTGGEALQFLKTAVPSVSCFSIPSKSPESNFRESACIRESKPENNRAPAPTLSRSNGTRLSLSVQMSSGYLE